MDDDAPQYSNANGFFARFLWSSGFAEIMFNNAALLKICSTDSKWSAVDGLAHVNIIKGESLLFEYFLNIQVHAWNFHACENSRQGIFQLQSTNYNSAAAPGAKCLLLVVCRLACLQMHGWQLKR